MNQNGEQDYTAIIIQSILIVPAGIVVFAAHNNLLTLLFVIAVFIAAIQAIFCKFT